MTVAAATLRAAADVLALAGEGIAAVVIATTDLVVPSEPPPEPLPGELRLVPATPAGAERRA